MNELNTRLLRTKTIPIRSQLGTLDRLADDEKSDLEFITPTKIQTHTKKIVSSELDTDQGEGITNKIKFAARQLNDSMLCHNYQLISCVNI